MKRINLKIGDDLHFKLKKKVVENQTTFQDKLIELIKKYLSSEG